MTSRLPTGRLGSGLKKQFKSTPDIHSALEQPVPKEEKRLSKTAEDLPDLAAAEGTLMMTISTNGQSASFYYGRNVCLYNSVTGGVSVHAKARFVVRVHIYILYNSTIVDNVTCIGAYSETKPKGRTRRSMPATKESRGDPFGLKSEVADQRSGSESTSSSERYGPSLLCLYGFDDAGRSRRAAAASRPTHEWAAFVTTRIAR